MSQNKSVSIFDNTVLGHPQGLFILFFTEMWERFSFYGMRALLVLFLISSLGEGGWDWNYAQALSLYGTYTSMVYLTPILGGFLADKYLGYRNAVFIGAIIMSLGHVSMAIETHHIFLYIGIACLIIGNGFFKPNMTSIISNMYKEYPEKKDGAYTIFYMGVNAGAFLGIMLCGYLGESMGWSYGFGLAGIFMLLGMIQFYFAQRIFGDIGKKPERKKIENNEIEEFTPEFEGDRPNPFTLFDRVLIFLSAGLGLIWIINDPMSKIANVNFLNLNGFDASNWIIGIAALLFVLTLILRIIRYPKQTKERMFAIIVFAFFMILYNASFEQAGGSMTIFAKSFTERILTGNWATGFMIIDMIISIVPVLIITWVLIALIKRTYKSYFLSSLTLIVSFAFIWFILIWKTNRDFNSASYVVSYQIKNKNELKEGESQYITLAELPNNKAQIASTDIRVNSDFKINQKVYLIDSDRKGNLKYVSKEKALNIEKERLIEASIVKLKDKEIEVKATWFGILNSLFIIMLAPLFSKWWESKFNPGATVKYGIGLILIGIGFGALAMGAWDIVKGQTTASVSMIWLVIAYLFHTMGELCISPVSLSYVSKLVPGRMIALMFGIWYIALAIGNKTAGKMGEQVEAIQENNSISFFFLIFTLIPIGIGIIAILIQPLIKKLMHGVR